MPKLKQDSFAAVCRTAEETAALIDQFIRHGGMWFEWYKLAGINNLGDQRELIRRLLKDLGRELAPGDELPDPRVEDYVEAEWIRDHGPALAEALEHHGFDSSGVLRIVSCAGRSGGGPAHAAASWPEIKVALQQSAIRLRTAGKEPTLPREDTWIPACKVWPGQFGSYREFCRWLKAHPEVRRRKPSPQRLEVHTGDWLRYQTAGEQKVFDDLGQEPLSIADDPACPDAFLASAIDRVANLRKKKAADHVGK